VGGFQGCSRDKQHNTWRYACAVQKRPHSLQDRGSKASGMGTSHVEVIHNHRHVILIQPQSPQDHPASYVIQPHLTMFQYQSCHVHLCVYNGGWKCTYDRGQHNIFALMLAPDIGPEMAVHCACFLVCPTILCPSTGLSNEGTGRSVLCAHRAEFSDGDLSKPIARPRAQCSTNLWCHITDPNPWLPLHDVCHPACPS